MRRIWFPLLVFLAAASANGEDSLADLLSRPGVSLSDPASRAGVVAHVRERAEERRKRARELANAKGLPVRILRASGTLQEIYDFDGDVPIYRVTHNSNAAISTGANLVRSSYVIDGNGVTIGMWDGGSGRSSHREFGSRMVVKDGAPSIDHATHVGGTLVASGVTSSARGMATAATVDSYDWNGDTSEMAARAATAPGQADKLYLSNHSYGFATGWTYTGNPARLWEWYGNGTGSTGIEEDFGRYDSAARDQDALSHGAPYYLIFRSAGNERTDNPAAGQTVALAPGSPTVVNYDPATHPTGDGQYQGGFDTIGFHALAKNVITVGAVNDAVTGGTRDLAKATMASFSSWGPADDGRIKPDVVANGAAVYSSFNGSDSAYGVFSGTSMSTPNATGSAALLVGHYASRFSGDAMRSATLKGLLIHTADDLGNAGPDYKFGWGLVDAKAAADLIADQQTAPDKQRLTEDELTTSVTSKSYTFAWDGASPIRATLCWTDPAGSATTSSDLRSPRLVNDLELRIIAPGGAPHLPYVMPFVGNWTQSAMNDPATTGVNHTDNVEQVYIASPPGAGTYVAVVSHTGNLADGSQQFSLLLSGAANVPPPPPPLNLTGVSPASGLSGPVTLDLTGIGFRVDTAVKLARAGNPDIPAGAVTLIDASLRCEFDLTGAASGEWDVVTTNPGGESSTLTAGFSVIGSLWNESFDGSPAPTGWVSDATTGANNWTITSSQSHSPANSHCAPAPSTKSTTNLVSPPIAIPAEATDMQFKFWHQYDLENRKDGGRLEFSLDGGSWFDVDSPGSGAAFVSNGYTATVRGTGPPSGRSEFAGLPAWTGNSNGFIETIVNLSDTAKYAGHSLQVRWRLATDNKNASAGWYVDSISLIGGGNIGNQPPVITSVADSSSTESVTDPDTTVFEIVRGASVDMSVSASDDGGEPGLSYTWSAADGPGPPVFFSPNGVNASKQSTAVFEALGDYRLSVSVSDPEGLTVSSAVNIRVLQEASSMGVAPGVASVVFGSVQAFSATLLDQFGGSMASQPSPITWTASGGGTIDAAGLFTATSAGGPFVVTGSHGGFMGTANVTVNPAPVDVSLSNLSQTYDGSPKAASVMTDPPGLAVSVTYDGSSALPINAGSYAVVATVTDPNYQGSASETLVIMPAGFPLWQELHFTEPERTAGLAHPHWDADLDGILNLIEYALGTNPREAGPAGLTVILQEDGASVERLSLVFTRPAGLFDVAYTALASDSLEANTWQEVNDVTVTSNDPPDTETVIVWDPVPASAATRRFIRLKITLTTPQG